ncbi:4454_t:CDS:1, partial [Acaulospora colombiana]
GKSVKRNKSSEKIIVDADQSTSVPSTDVQQVFTILITDDMSETDEIVDVENTTERAEE